jgi:hypothetical protein
MAKRRAPNKGKKCVRFKRVAGKKVCAKFGHGSATKRRKSR